MMTKRFDGRIVAITGAAGGIGQELCRHFASEGATVFAIDKKDSVIGFVDELAEEGIQSRALVCDIGDATAITAGIARLIKENGAVDILVNNAGFSDHPTIKRTPPDAWRFDINGNLNGAYNCVYAVLPGMQKKGKGAIVTVGSINGLSALGDPAYSAAKAALISMTKAIAMEYGRFGIRANIVLPGTVRTPIWNERAAKDPSILKNLIRWYPLARIAEPGDIANAVLFLASDQASAITGTELAVDCGLTAGNIVMSRELTLEDF
jgi:NAD(P)-dependent dehydrogenase (short-subunit alcohol dehydrogenase family)